MAPWHFLPTPAADPARWILYVARPLAAVHSQRRQSGRAVPLGWGRG